MVWPLWKIYILPAVWIRSSDLPWKPITLKETDVERKEFACWFFFFFSFLWFLVLFKILTTWVKEGKKLFNIYFLSNFSMVSKQPYCWYYYSVQRNQKQMKASFLGGSIKPVTEVYIVWNKRQICSFLLGLLLSMLKKRIFM